VIVELPGAVTDYSVGKVRHYKMGFFHFSNNNLAIRKQCAADLGMYDLKTAKSEDVEICFRIAQHPRWVALRESGSVVRHKARKSFIELVKQMWGWGYHSGYPYAKTGIHGIYLYWLSSIDHKIKFDVEIERFPFLVCMFLTDFHIAHLLLGSALLAAIMGSALVSTLLIVASLPFIWRYLHDDRHCGLPLWKTLQLASVHYVANVVFSTATILGALKRGVILLPCSIFRPRGPDRA
jgi:hypothetical protein